MNLLDNNTINISDNGRGIPVDNHPKFKNKSALEIIMTTLHSVENLLVKIIKSGGLHGVGASVVNALSSFMKVEVIRNGHSYFQEFSRGLPTSNLIKKDIITKNNGTSITFRPDHKIFGENNIFNPIKIFNILENKAFLFKGVQINWSCDEILLKKDSIVPSFKKICYHNGILDYMKHKTSSISFLLHLYFMETLKLMMKQLNGL